MVQVYPNTKDREICLAGPGCAQRFGVSLLPDQTVQFTVFAPYAARLILGLFSPDGKRKIKEFTLDPATHRTGSVWHIACSNLPEVFAYGYQVCANGSKTPFLLDPYALRVAPCRVGQTQRLQPLGLVDFSACFDWQDDRPPHIACKDLVIYEMHVAGFTKDASSQVQHPGTFLGVAEKAGYLADLGINAVELMPIFFFNPKERERCSLASKQTLGNFWGYSPLNFFSPAPHYGTRRTPGCEVEECKEMVRALHAEGIEVLLDVVYNHTGDPTLSFQGLADAVYYMKNEEGYYLNYSGCGNTFNCNHPVCAELIVKSLRYWVAEMHVDGFRFDLASIFSRDQSANVQQNSPVISMITQDPVLSQVKLIAEPWDAAGLYQVGSFSPVKGRWSEWNDRYRDVIRGFIKGDTPAKGEFATRLCGSQDLYHDAAPCSSINFITAHDGFTLADLVSYNEKHNEDNGEANRDGNNHNLSWNCGEEGATKDASILARRLRQQRNFFVALLISRGIPMILMADEYGRTKRGNNNTWCIDDSRNWFQWDKLKQNRCLYRFVKELIAFRKKRNVLRTNAFYRNQDITWHGLRPNQANWNGHNPYLACTIYDQKRGEQLYAAFNVGDESAKFTLPIPPSGKQWQRIIDTAEPPPFDFLGKKDRHPIGKKTIFTSGHSAVLLETIK